MAIADPAPSSSTSQQSNQWHETQAESTSEYFANGRSEWTPVPITPPSAGINTYLSPPSRGTTNPMPQAGGSRHSWSPQANPSAMPPFSSGAQQHPHHHSHPFSHTRAEFGAMANHFDAVPSQSYYGPTADIGAPNSADMEYNFSQTYGDGYVPPTERRVPYPSTWPHTIQSVYEPHHDPNAAHFKRH
ncbi:hypothetical protein K438DRAFT_1962581 [Mycena galopus ATCC 62051]|nr:hypothetical protein K438DRAFT_1962581 [Mycena galopus ATCC 62051]